MAGRRMGPRARGRFAEMRPGVYDIDGEASPNSDAVPADQKELIRIVVHIP